MVYRLCHLGVLLLMLCPLNTLATTAGVEEVRSIARLYTAAFDRYPKGAGLNFWVDDYEYGESLVAIARKFQQSPEFTSKYGTLGDRQFIEQLYQNILGRPGQPDGVDFWTGHLSNGTSRGLILAAFAAAPETVTKTADAFADMHMNNGWWLFGPDQPATGLLGLSADSPVSGVAYVTPRYRGVTALDGSFQYQAGEPIRFHLGSTVLGEVTARALMTPFELAGSAVLTGTPTITRALENERDPFHTLVNLAVLLQSLDSDADPGTGIEISAEVAALFGGLNLDVSQPWKRFRENFALHQALAQANNQGLFSEAHPVVNPAPALRNLYDALAIDARTFAVSLEQTGAGDGTVSDSSRWQYDADGNPTSREVSDRQGRVQKIENWTYNAQGYRTQYEREDNDGESTESRQYDTSGKLIRETRDWGGDGVADEILSYQYNAEGHLIRQTREWEGSKPETILSIDWQYSYDSGGRLARVELNSSGQDGQSGAKSTTRYQYDADGRLIRVELSGSDLDLATEWLGIPGISYLNSADTYTVTWEYNADGELIRDTRDGIASNSNLSAQYVVTRQYNTIGQVIHLESRLEGAILPIPEEHKISDYEYDEYGNVIREVLDDNGDGTPDLVNSWHYDYDDHGKVIRLEWDEGSDGQPEQIQNWRYQYDAQGRVVREEWDESGDDTPDQIVSYTYYANGQPSREDRLFVLNSHDIVDWEYDAAGNLVQEIRDFQGSGVPSAAVTYAYNAVQNTVVKSLDEDLDGTPDQVDTRYYDARGNLTRQDEGGDGTGPIYRWQYNPTGDLTRFEADADGNGEAEAFERWVYDGRGKLLRSELVCHGNVIFPFCFFSPEGLGAFDSVVLHYDAGGRLTLTVFDADGDGKPDNIVKYTYDASGNLLRAATDRGADGTPDEIVSYTYDANGNVLRAETDREADGTPDSIVSYAYDTNDNLVSEATDRDGDGGPDIIVNYAYEATGWGHIFSELPEEDDDWSWNPGTAPVVDFWP